MRRQAEPFGPKFGSRREAFTSLAVGAAVSLVFGALAYAVLTRVLHDDPGAGVVGILLPLVFQTYRLRRPFLGIGLGAVAGLAAGYGLGALALPGGVVLPWTAGVVTGALVAWLAGQPRDP